MLYSIDFDGRMWYERLRTSFEISPEAYCKTVAKCLQRYHVTLQNGWEHPLKLAGLPDNCQKFILDHIGN